MRKTCVIVIDEEAIFKEIQERKPASIAINGPDGMLPAVQTTASNITKKFGIPTYVLADTTWGSCDLNSNGAKVLGADVLFNVGHTIGVPMWDKQVVMVDAFDDVSFEKVAEKAAKVFYEKTVSLVTDSQHLHRIDQVRGILEKGKRKSCCMKITLTKKDVYICHLRGFFCRIKFTSKNLSVTELPFPFPIFTCAPPFSSMPRT